MYVALSIKSKFQKLEEKSKIETNSFFSNQFSPIFHEKTLFLKNCKTSNVDIIKSFQLFSFVQGAKRIYFIR